MVETAEPTAATTISVCGPTLSPIAATPELARSRIQRLSDSSTPTMARLTPKSCMVERQHGIEQRVADAGDGDDQSRQRHADRRVAAVGGGRAHWARSTRASRSAAATERRAAAGAVQQHGRAQEAVQHAAELHEVGQRAFLLQAKGVGTALVAQRVVAGGDHQRGRQAGERSGAQRRDAPVAARAPCPACSGRRTIPWWRRSARSRPRSGDRSRCAPRRRSRDRREAAGWSLGPPLSRAQIATAAARLPPALSPPMASRVGSMPTDGPLAATHFSPATTSSKAPGKRASGASR